MFKKSLLAVCIAGLSLTACGEQAQPNVEATASAVKKVKLIEEKPNKVSQAKTSKEASKTANIKVSTKTNYSPYADRDYPTQLLFGETHIHSALSADAGGGGTTLLPRDLYRFARGEQVLSNTSQPVKLDRPLDFICLTEHTDGMGLITDLFKGTEAILADKQGAEFHQRFSKGGAEAKQASFDLISAFANNQLSDALLYQPGNPGYTRTWHDLVQAAEEFNEPHKFTTMISYEWTSMVKGNNLHRNIILRDGPDRALQVLPFTMTAPIGSANPQDLWQWLTDYEKTTGGRAIAIPHNGNLSNGWLFALQDDFNNGAKFDLAYVTERAKWEKLVEVGQTKGDSETHPVLSPDDEFADYETWDFGNLDLTTKKTDAMLATEYTRSALKNGLLLDTEFGVNPFKLGFVGGGDLHTSLVTQDDDNFFGAFAWMEPSKKRLNQPGKYNKKLDIGYDAWRYATPGPTAVWATSNTRAGIFDAMKRKEVYATTGPRIRLRVFAGYDFVQSDLKQRDIASVGYNKGVPMGGDLTNAKDGQTPSLLIRALRDPDGANLDRVQVIKGWVDSKGKAHEKVYDVAWSGKKSGGRKINAKGKLAAVGDTVDLSIPTWTNTIGSAQLETLWTDPNFDALEKAFYYVRAIEIPTPRWTAYDAVRYQVTSMPKGIKLKTQERAYTSPIWYNSKG
ncbi:MAG: DUF3604 domain-containing protein [Colwellia sp.]|nr:DUF3604 domain-containing protein [Colwellia sp.]